MNQIQQNYNGKEKFQKNVLGEKLEPCSNDPITGWFRDGCCNTDEMIREFIQFVQKLLQNF